MTENVLVGKRCYLSGPIENDTNPTHNWRNEPKIILTEEFKLNVFDPFDDPKQQHTSDLYKARDEKDYETVAKIAKGFVRKDLCLVDRSDLLIACLHYKIPTTGTHHEIINSNNAKKPTLLICPQGKEKIPLWYFGFIPHEMMFGSWDDLYNYLREVNNGMHKHNDRWAYVYDLV